MGTFFPDVACVVSRLFGLSFDGVVLYSLYALVVGIAHLSQCNKGLKSYELRQNLLLPQTIRIFLSCPKGNCRAWRTQVLCCLQQFSTHPAEVFQLFIFAMAPCNLCVAWLLQGFSCPLSVLFRVPPDSVFPV